MNIQGDQPVFSPEQISLLTSPLLHDPDVAMSTLKYRIRDESEIHNPNHVKVVTDTRNDALYFSRCPIPYFRDFPSKAFYYKHLGFYAFRMGFLVEFARLPEGTLEAVEKLEQLRVIEFGYKIKVVETPHNSIEVDVPSDIRRVEATLHGVAL